MTPSACKNCHSGNFTQAPKPSLLTLSKQVELPAPEGDCSAEDYWRDWLKVPVPQMQDQEWWVRSNYEKTFKLKALAEGRQSPAFRIKVKSGQIDLRLIPSDFSFGIKPNQGKFYASNHRVFFLSDPAGGITGQIPIQDNRIPLLLKGLAQFSGIRVGLGSSLLFETAPEALQVGNYGDLHFTMTTKAGSRGVFDFLQAPGTPKMPVGFDWPHGDEPMDPACVNPTEAEAKRLECPPVASWVYQNPSDPKRDLLLTPFLPEELLSEQGRLPKAYDLEDLLIRIVKLTTRIKSTPPKTEPSLINFKEILSLANLREGSKLTLKLEELTDLFIPGVLDLGPSAGTIELSVGADRRIHFSASDLTVNFDPMDYPSGKTLDAPKPDICQPDAHVSLERPGTRLHYATLSPGTLRKDEHGVEWKPGIHGSFDPATGLIEVSANLHLDGQITLPFLGKVEGNTDILVATTLALTPEGIVPLPKTNVLELRDGIFFRIPEKKPKEPVQNGDNFLVSDFNLSLSDDPKRVSAEEALNYHPWPNWNLDVSGLFPKKVTNLVKENGMVKKKEEWVHVRDSLQAKMEIPILNDGSYDGSELLGGISLKGTVNLHFPQANKKPTEVYFGSFQLRPSVFYSGKGPWGADLDYHLLANVEKGALGSEERTELLKNAHLNLKRVAKGCTDRWALEWNAESFDLSLKDEKLAFNGIDGKLSVERIRFSQDILNITVPEFHAAVNTRGSKTGLLRGLVSLAQVPGKSLEITFNTEDKELQVRDLDLKFTAQQLYVLKGGALKMLDPEVRSIGLDGNLTGIFQASFKGEREKWKGSGLIQLLGDEKGDLYFLDARGRQVGPALIRNTHWDFNKVRGVNWNRGYAMGDFYLAMVINLAALNLFSGGSALPALSASPRLNGLGPFELVFEMGYDNQPVTPGGFKNRIEDYLISVCHQTPACMEKLKKPANGTAPGGKP